MRVGLHGVAIVALAVSGISVAAGQTAPGGSGVDMPIAPKSNSLGKLDLTPAQQQTIARDLAQEITQRAPAGFKPSVGADVPLELVLYPLPLQATKKVPAAKEYDFVKLQQTDQILIVDPKDRKVAALFSVPASTTGSGASGTTPEK